MFNFEDDRRGTWAIWSAPRCCLRPVARVICGLFGGAVLRAASAASRPLPSPVLGCIPDGLIEFSSTLFSIIGQGCSPLFFPLPALRFPSPPPPLGHALILDRIFFSPKGRRPPRCPSSAVAGGGRYQKHPRTRGFQLCTSPHGEGFGRMEQFRRPAPVRLHESRLFARWLSSGEKWEVSPPFRFGPAWPEVNAPRHGWAFPSGAVPPLPVRQPLFLL